MPEGGSSGGSDDGLDGAPATAGGEVGGGMSEDEEDVTAGHDEVPLGMPLMPRSDWAGRF